MAKKDTPSWFALQKEKMSVLAERIHILYNPPREYFTIGIPVAIGVLLVLGAFLAGFTFMGVVVLLEVTVVAGFTGAG